jgi:hypothetical protein
MLSMMSKIFFLWIVLKLLNNDTTSSTSLPMIFLFSTTSWFVVSNSSSNRAFVIFKHFAASLMTDTVADRDSSVINAISPKYAFLLS